MYAAVVKQVVYLLEKRLQLNSMLSLPSRGLFGTVFLGHTVSLRSRSEVAKSFKYSKLNIAIAFNKKKMNPIAAILLFQTTDRLLNSW